MSTQNRFAKVILQNGIAALTVSFVALSLGAAFGLLSGRGAFAGMLSAALIASITAALGGTRVQCSGPTGPMTAVTAVLLAAAYDRTATDLAGISAEHFVNLTLLMTAGILLLFSLARLGRFVTLIPNVVVSGFMSGIAVIIWIDQFRKLFGFGGEEKFDGAVSANLALAAASAVLVFALPRLTQSFLPKFAGLLSATFITIVSMTALAAALDLSVERVQLQSSIRSVSDAVDIVAKQWPTGWSVAAVAAGLPFAFQLAVLAYLDTLMTSLVVDKATKETTKPNKELMAQGVATAAVAAVGGIPGAQATIRSVLIVKEGATLRIAGVLVGVFALVEMLLFQNAINLIPLSVFAGILVKVGYDVFDWLPLRLYFKQWFREPKTLFHDFLSRHDDQPIFVTNREMMIIAGTAVVTVAWDLNLAVAAFTGVFYVHNFALNRKNPIRDLKPVIEAQLFTDEP